MLARLVWEGPARLLWDLIFSLLPQTRCLFYSVIHLTSLGPHIFTIAQTSLGCACQTSLEVLNCPCDICPHLEYLGCYLPDFDETLNVPLREHLKQIPTIKLTFVKLTFVLGTFVHY